MNLLKQGGLLLTFILVHDKNYIAI